MILCKMTTIVLLVVSIILLLVGLTMTIIGLSLGFFTDAGFTWYDWLLFGIGVGLMVLAIILMVAHYAMKCNKKSERASPSSAPAPPLPPRENFDRWEAERVQQPIQPVVQQPMQPVMRRPASSVPVNRWDPRNAYTGSDVLGQLQGTGFG
jgi:hypothetical protein